MRRLETISSHVGFRRFCHLQRRGDAVVLILHHELLNALTVDMRAALLHFFNEADNDSSVKCIIIAGEGGAFSCGIDINDFAASLVDTTKENGVRIPSLPSLTTRIEQSDKVVIAATSGITYSGGLELALAAHYRVASPTSVFCMPEVKLGIVPCGGATQRLPRLIGVRAALDIISTGRKVSAKEALRLGLIDHLTSSPHEERRDQDVNGVSAQGPFCCTDPNGNLESAIEAALRLSARWTKPRRISCDATKLGIMLYNSILFRRVGSEITKKAPKEVSAPLQCLQAIRAATNSASFKEGLAEETRIFKQTLHSPEAHAMQHLLRSSYTVLSDTLPTLPVRAGTGLQQQRLRKLAVVGCGVVGIGIVIMALRAGSQVVLLGEDDNECEYALHVIKSELPNDALGYNISADCVNMYLNNLKVLPYHGDLQTVLQDVDVMAECIVGDLDTKRQVFTMLTDLCPPHCVLATCCSSLELREFVKVSRRPEKVVGMYFAPPVHNVPFLEVTRGYRTDHTTLQRAIHVGRLFHKATILTRDVGFSIISRIFFAILYQALSMLEQGAFPVDIDRAMRHFGFRLGIFAMEDLAGLQVVSQILNSLRVREGCSGVRSPCPPTDVFTIHRRLVEMGHFGQKTGRGWYTYEEGDLFSSLAAWRQRLIGSASNSTKNTYGVWSKGGASLMRRPYQDRDVELLILDVCREKKIMRRDISRKEMIERILFAAVNEAAMLLREEAVSSSSAIDIATTFGHGFPAWRGGLCYYADKFGLPNVVHRMRIYNKTFGDALFPLPCEELRQMASSQQTFRSTWP
ncbi:enoyl-CoA hydratase/Enoyl-CoA isomerase/3-hydroxyacyl-CoA dehydrogenase, putative [Trypanosoma brucei brucei TREU927]|uniref:Enoyl-CoA hydratase/Enoyl-CoA isomerase/3-hydroxyacyl-CoA dehydrogenase, putative n=1 Tax=Trypanosoma brucei brucei (strain 927/4 GUTat10.1) TaxID=185431 RepID=Q586V7_TRYB2|nr:enoyl-CoA hydratase/Enoyl-CoA isomerase/3-hydroxyacyl-CoA dehydrogenase, putative [Trypanosoma brucei brucei TREU927]AAQ15870.1 enoyl-CoA hydratase/Enoyl-CoA isomerase/3-hydroxyacyl-CoA dehydrogenase, putative [Trypanosoma brucei brucei TREU927]AAX79634.1 enoyl-CoA hydratase/Enoyl-CoA isomerase/3-hydroxyacyl-CoA dehydrogenase, putative [Trypanosoma brucei]